MSYVTQSAVASTARQEDRQSADFGSQAGPAAAAAGRPGTTANRTRPPGTGHLDFRCRSIVCRGSDVTSTVRPDFSASAYFAGTATGGGPPDGAAG